MIRSQVVVMKFSAQVNFSAKNKYRLPSLWYFFPIHFICLSDVIHFSISITLTFTLK